MRARLVPLLLLCLPAFAASPDMQWQAPRILPPKGEATSASASASASSSTASKPAANATGGASAAGAKSNGPVKPAGASANASASVIPASSGAFRSTSASATAGAASPNAAGKPGSAPELAAKIKEKLEATQLPAPKHSRPTERSANSSFMTQEEFRARLAAAAANATASAKSQPPAPKVLNVVHSKKTTPAVTGAPPRKPSVHPGHWGYSGEAGPEHWGDLSPEWARCGNGTRQSPIDIRDGFKLELEAPLFEYQPSLFGVLDNGHTIQVNINSANAITLMGRRFQLAQFHFHRPSEERLEGKGFEMVIHLVHKDDAGRLAVVAVMIERGAPNAQVQSVWNNLPLEKNESLTATSRIDLEQLLPTRREYYTYMGSLTTPPCSEGVLWVVMKQPITLSPQQIGIFARLYPMNARPLQAAGDRLIKESN